MSHSFSRCQSTNLQIVGEKKHNDLEDLLIRPNNEDSPTFYLSIHQPTSFINDHVTAYYKAKNSYNEETNTYDEEQLSNCFNSMTPEAFLSKSLIFKTPDLKKGYFNFQNHRLDNYIFKDDQESLDRIIKSAYNSMIEFLERIMIYAERKEDKSYSFSLTKGKEYFPEVAEKFKEKVVDEIFLYEDFEIEIMKILGEFKKDKTKNIPLYKFEQEKKVYTVVKDISVDEIIKNSRFPEVKEFSLIGVRMKSLNDYQYLFSDRSPRYDESNVVFDEYYDLMIDINHNSYYNKNQIKKTQTGYFHFNKEVFLFDSKKEAESFFKNELKEIRAKIDKILNREVIF